MSSSAESADLMLNCAYYSAGITPRFGKDIFDRLAKEKHVEMKNNPLPGKVWTLTQEVGWSVFGSCM